MEIHLLQLALLLQEHRGFGYVFVAATLAPAGQQEMKKCLAGKKGSSAANLKLAA